MVMLKEVKNTDFSDVDTTGKLAFIALYETKQSGLVGVGMDQALAKAAAMAWKRHIL